MERRVMVWPCETCGGGYLAGLGNYIDHSHGCKYHAVDYLTCHACIAIRPILNRKELRKWERMFK